MSTEVKSRRTARYLSMAEKLSQDAEDNASFSVHISAEDVAAAMGDLDWDPDEDPFKELRKWIDERRLLGFDPTAADILDWMDAA